jgi:hypothetical protein
VTLQRIHDHTMILLSKASQHCDRLSCHVLFPGSDEIHDILESLCSNPCLPNVNRTVPKTVYESQLEPTPHSVKALECLEDTNKVLTYRL